MHVGQQKPDWVWAMQAPTSDATSGAGSAEAWRGEVLQYIAEGFPKVALTSAFLERLQSEWTLEHLQQIAEAVKVEYGASRGGYALEVYLALQRIQNSAENGSFSEAEDVKALLDGLQVGEARLDHVCNKTRTQAMAGSDPVCLEGWSCQGSAIPSRPSTLLILPCLITPFHYTHYHTLHRDKAPCLGCSWLRPVRGPACTDAATTKDMPLCKSWDGLHDVNTHQDMCRLVLLSAMSLVAV